MTSNDDVKLLSLIAAQRDEAAFSEIYARYKRPAYSLALSILGDAKVAEEAVQEGMVRIWSSAKTFRMDVGIGPPNPKAWILKIIARESSRVLLRRKKRSKEISQQIDVADTRSDDPTESTELAQALRQSLLELTEDERQMIALHYGGGLSQTEISETLAISQQSISHRIQRTLKKLRGSLASAGFSATVLVMNDALESVLSSGHSPSPDLHARIVERLNTRSSFKTKGQPIPKSSLPLKAAAAAVLVCAAAAWSVWRAATSQTVAPTPMTPPMATKSITPPSPAPEIANQSIQPLADWHRRWTFENGAPKDLFVISGNWNWNKQAASMDIPDEIQILPTYVLPSQPLIFTAKGTVIDLTKPATDGVTILDKEAKIAQANNSFKKLQHFKNREIVHKIYIYHRRIVATSDDDPVMVSEYSMDLEGGSITFLFMNFSIRELSVAPLTESEVPDVVKNPELTKK
jgi:RNA polymerase sigma factor (sigma-70 family)